MMEATARQTVLHNTIHKRKKQPPLSAHDRRKPLYQAVYALLPTGNSARTAYLHCIKDGMNIDPPYNTGNDFVYNDNFAMSSKDSDIAEGSRDDEGNPLQKNQQSSNRYHANWLNMMYPRLKMAKDLLTDDGVIFISIGQNENHNLIKCCDEIYSESNRVGVISRMMKSGGNKGQYFSPNIEYILVYAKNLLQLEYFRESISEDNASTSYNNIETTGERVGEKFAIKGLCQPGLGIRPNQRYWIECPDGSYIIPRGVNFPTTIREGEKILPTDEDTCWKWIYDRYKQEKQKGNIIFKPSSTATALVDENGNTAKWNVFNKIWLSDRIEQGRVPVDIITKWENRISSQELKNMAIPFDFAKPTELIKYLISIVALSSDDLILDFFSGSATTAHAVIQLNTEDSGNRKFIMVQLPEETGENSEAYKAGYQNICEIGKERIRRAGEKIKQEIEAANAQLKIDEESRQVPDIGFKVFRTADTNIKWNLYDALGQLDTSAMTHTPDLADFTEGFSDIDVVYEVMLRQKDVPLSSTLETLTDSGSRTYLYGSAYLVCLETEVTEELIDKLAALDPLPIKFIFRDSAFKDDINLKDETFRRLKNLIERNSGLEKKSYTVEFI